MNKKKFLHTITFVLLTLMFFKVSAVHAYTHQDTSSDQIENCNICESAIENQNAEYSFSQTVVVKTQTVYNTETTSFSIITQSFTSSKVHFRLFGRPPPAVS